MPDSNDVSLRDYVETLFQEKEKALQAALLAQEKAVAAALESSDKAITKAEINSEKWRENANEWRGAMSDRDRELPSRREVEAALTSVTDRLAMVEKRLDLGTGRGEGISLSLGTLIAVLTLIVAVAAVIVIASSHP